MSINIEEKIKRLQHEASKPLGGYLKELPFYVFIWDANNDEVEHHKLNFSDHDDKQWLAKLTVWAWSKGYTVETMTEAVATKCNLI